MAKVLIVDDEDMIREVLAESLTSEGHTVLEADSKAAALEVFNKEKPKIVVSDFSMPAGNGLQLLQELRTQQQPVAFALVTAYADSDDVMIKGVEPDALFKKPFDLNAIHQFITLADRKVREDWKRKHVRLECVLEATANGSPWTVPVLAEVQNISAGGCFLKLPKEATLPAANSPIQFLINAQSGLKSNIQGTGICKWICESYDLQTGKPRGFGLEFTEISDTDRRLIRELVANLVKTVVFED